MVASLDGFISKPDETISWMRSTDHFEKGITLTEAYITEFNNSIDCYVMGSHTYEQAIKLGWPYGDKPVFVLTSRQLRTDQKNVEFLDGDLIGIVNNRLRPHYKNIWMVGGTSLTKEFLQLGLADDLNVSIMPILLGSGKLFFDFIGREQLLHLKDVTAFKDGMVELWYEIKKE